MTDTGSPVDAELLARLLTSDHPGVEVLDATDGSASRMRLGLTYAPDADAVLPATMFLKRARFSFPSEMYYHQAGTGRRVDDRDLQGVLVQVRRLVVEQDGVPSTKPLHQASSSCVGSSCLGRS